MIDKDVLVKLATKYLDRIEVKGLIEHHEFGTLVSFFAAMERDEIIISNVQHFPAQQQPDQE